jgi:Rrf2 family protein
MFRYGLRALAVLAERYGKGTVSAKEISEQEDISPSFLEQLLAQLRRNGLVTGVRGPGGGFKLVKPPSKIAINEIVEALEGPVCVARCLDESSDPSSDPCDRYDNCLAVPLLRRLEEDLSSVLSSYRLSDLLEMHEERMKENRS